MAGVVPDSPRIIVMAVRLIFKDGNSTDEDAAELAVPTKTQPFF